MGAPAGGVARRAAPAALLRDHGGRRQGDRRGAGAGARARRPALARAKDREMTSPVFLRHVVRLASLLVPRWRRRDWAREWNAELDADVRENGTNRSTLVDRSAGAVADAMSLRSHAMYLDLWWGDVRFAWRNAVRRPG